MTPINYGSDKDLLRYLFYLHQEKANADDEYIRDYYQREIELVGRALNAKPDEVDAVQEVSFKSKFSGKNVKYWSL